MVISNFAPLVSRRRGESAASSPSGSFVQAAPSADSTPKGTPSEESQKEPTGGRPGEDTQRYTCDDSERHAKGYDSSDERNAEEVFA